MARPLTKRERNLALLFGLTIFVAANVIGVSALWQKQQQFRAHIAKLSLERKTADALLAEKDLWQQRRDWLDKNQPRMGSTGEANVELLDALTASAAQHSVTIVDHGFSEPDAARNPHYQEIAVKMKVSGSLESITRWLVEIQQPEKFQAIPALTMKIDSDPAKIVCDLTVSRYYAP